MHLVAGLGAICRGCYFRISAIEGLFLIAAIASVLCAEALNTALKRTVDRTGAATGRGDAKDLAAASVLIASLCSLIVGVILFGPRLFDFSSGNWNARSALGLCGSYELLHSRRSYATQQNERKSWLARTAAFDGLMVLL